MGRPRKQQPIVYVPRVSFVTEIDGVPVRFAEGVTTVREGHSVLRGRESMFKPLIVEYDIEEATDEPGVLRQR